MVRWSIVTTSLLTPCMIIKHPRPCQLSWQFLPLAHGFWIWPRDLFWPIECRQCDTVPILKQALPVRSTVCFYTLLCVYAIIIGQAHPREPGLDTLSRPIHSLTAWSQSC